MKEPVSINRCAEYLGVTRGQVKAALTLGVVRHGGGEGKVIPKEVFEALVDNGTLLACPCCDVPVGARPDDDEGVV